MSFRPTARRPVNATCPSPSSTGGCNSPGARPGCTNTAKDRWSGTPGAIRRCPPTSSGPWITTAARDEPIPFVASIDCGALPPGALDIALPADGCLLFFTDYDDFNAGDSRVIYVPEGTPTAERAARYPEDTYGRFPLHYVPHWKLPEDEASPAAPVRPGQPLPPAPSRGTWVGSGGPPDTGKMTLGGYVTKIQDDPRPDDKSRVLLAETSVGEDTFGEWRGFAIIHWIIPQEDLAEKRFDRVEAVKAQVH